MRLGENDRQGADDGEIRSTGTRRLFWSGVLLALASFLSYFGVTLNLPGSAGFTWIHELLAVGGAGMAIIGWWRLPSRHVIRIGTGTAVALGALLLGYVHVYTSSLPSIEGVIEVGQAAPNFSLPGPDGQNLGLDAYLGKPLVLVFYRGYW